MYAITLNLTEAETVATALPPSATMAQANTLPPLTDLSAVSNGIVALEFDPVTRLLSGIRRMDEDGVSARVTQDLVYYHSYGKHVHASKRKSRGQIAGAYIFRPSQASEKPTPVRYDVEKKNCNFTTLSCPVTVTVFRGKEVTEVRQVFSSWATQTIRLKKGSPSVEFEWTVGPVPVKDGHGKDVLSRFSSSVDSGKLFFTDSNGLEYLPRTRNARPTWALVRAK